jgi:hypothetical protein
LKGKRKLVWTSRNFKYLVILAWFLFLWSIRQDSVHLELYSQESFFFPLEGNLVWITGLKESCVIIKKNKNLERMMARSSTSGIWHPICFGSCFKPSNACFKYSSMSSIRWYTQFLHNTNSHFHIFDSVISMAARRTKDWAGVKGYAEKFPREYYKIFKKFYLFCW